MAGSNRDLSTRLVARRRAGITDWIIIEFQNSFLLSPLAPQISWARCDVRFTLGLCEIRDRNRIISHARTFLSNCAPAALTAPVFAQKAEIELVNAKWTELFNRATSLVWDPLYGRRDSISAWFDMVKG